MTFLVNPSTDVPMFGRWMIRWYIVDLTELIKLDFPEPTGPKSKTFTRGRDSSNSLYETKFFIRSSLVLYNRHNYTTVQSLMVNDKEYIDLLTLTIMNKMKMCKMKNTLQMDIAKH